MLPPTFDRTYTTAHFTQLHKFSENNIRGKMMFVTLRQVQHALHLTHSFQFRDEASLVH